MTIGTSKIVNALKEFTMEFETYNYTLKDFKEEDVLAYPKKILIEAMMDKVYFLQHGSRKSGKTGTDVYAANRRREFESDYSALQNGEIAQNQVRQSMMNSRAASAKNDLLGQLIHDLQQLYVDSYLEEYIPYGAPKTGNLPTHEVEIDKDLEAEMAAMIGANTNTSKKKVA